MRGYSSFYNMMICMSLPLMPKATAVWLIDNTTLTFRQISEFCGLHILEIETLADGDAQVKVLGYDPIAVGQLTSEDIRACEKDPMLNLPLRHPENSKELARKLEKKYTPLSKRKARPDAIAWILRYHPNIPDNIICRLLSTTKPTVQAIRNKSHWNSMGIKPKDPVFLGLCTQADLDTIVTQYSQASSETLPFSESTHES